MEQKDIDRIIEMAWEDRTPFEAIKTQFGFSSVFGLVTNNMFNHHSELLNQTYQFLLHKIMLRNIYIPVDSLPGSMDEIMDYCEYKLVFELVPVYSKGQHLMDFSPKTDTACQKHLRGNFAMQDPWYPVAETSFVERYISKIAIVFFPWNSYLEFAISGVCD